MMRLLRPHHNALTNSTHGNHASDLNRHVGKLRLPSVLSRPL